MAQDPFPGVGNTSADLRLETLFRSSNTVLVVDTDPVKPKENLFWFNRTTGKLKLFSGGRKWIIGTASPEV